MLFMKFRKWKKIFTGFSGQFGELLAVMRDLLVTLERLIWAVRGRTAPQLIVTGGDLTFDLPGYVSITTQLQPEEFMANRNITLPATTEDRRFSLAPIGEVKDGEGSLITDYTEKFESSAPDVVSVTPDDTANLSAGGNTHFGTPGVAVVVHSITTKVGRAQTVSVLDTTTFIVTPGAPLEVTGGEASFEGLEADPVDESPVE